MSNVKSKPKTKNLKPQQKIQKFLVLICGFGFWLLIFKFSLDIGI